jgi:hypothetical protein
MEMKENKRCSIVFQGHGRRWIMGDGNGKLFFVGKFLQLLFPQAVPYPIRPTSIGGDEQMLFVGIERFS